MSKINVKGVEMFLYKNGGTPLALVPTGISKSKPAVVSVADTTGVIAGSPVVLTDTGYPELDGKLLVVGSVDGGANTFEVLGSDTTNSTATLGVSPKATVSINADRVKLCLSSIDIAAPSVNQIDVSTFCAEATMAGRATPGQISMGGFVEKDSAAFAELVLADDDGAERNFLVVLPSGNGYLEGAITLAGLGYEVPLEGAVSFTISGSQTKKIKYVH